MTLNSFTFNAMTVQTPESWSGPRVAGEVDTAQASARWPWPLPIDSVLAIFDDAADLPVALTSLHAAGIAADDIWSVSGKTGADTLQTAFSQRGTLGRLRSLLGSEDEIVAHLIERCERGGAALLVRTPNHQPIDIVEVATQHGARLVRRTGRWLSEWTVPGV
jgi:hypothetical protein